VTEKPAAAIPEKDGSLSRCRLADQAPCRQRVAFRARALLVSHWAVDSEAATRLTTATFGRFKSSPGIGRAEALRQAMLDYLNDASSAKNA
jgi:CHAT domain-containing protein